MPWYEFVDEKDYAHTVFYAACDVPSIGETVEIDGKQLTRVACSSATLYPAGQNPAKDNERREAQRAFETPLYPGHKTGADLVKEGYPTLASPRWV